MENRKLRGFITTWHTAHQYDLVTALKDDVQFDILVNTNKQWAGRPLPVPEQTKFVGCYRPGYYDFAILNTDQQCINREIYKSHILPQLLSVVTDIPVIVLQHGGPVYPEFVAKNGVDFSEAEKIICDFVKKLIGDRTMVVNSHTAASAQEWGWGYPIVHGMDSTLFIPHEQKEPRVITSLSPGGCDSYYNREMMFEVGTILQTKYGIKMQWAKRTHEFEFDAFRDWLGSSLVYLDTSVRTPMNRSRTEAMLSGCAVIQVEGAHDLDRFFKDKENIYLTPNNNPEAMADLAAELISTRFDEAVQIGKNARENAIKHFNYQRYRDDWITLLTNLGIKH